MMNICRQFRLKGNVLSCQPYGSGHINATFWVHTDQANYILQRVNRHIFRDVPALMRNIQQVTAFLARRDPDPRHSLRLVPTLEGGGWLEAGGEFYRVYDFITDSLCLDAPETPEDFYQSAVAFGSFQQALADFPAGELSETIPRFHDTPDRYRALKQAIQEDAKGRAASCGPEIRFALEREADGAFLMEQLHAGRLPLRVTHNDTKLNNVMLDARTRRALCVIDLDTVMPGLAANDFGDSIRFGANTGAEDEQDLSKISLSLERYRIFAEGYLQACGQSLTPFEKETLPWGAKLMTLECGVRFLTDYLAGDTYFRIHRPQHNLDRARTQFALVRDMEARWPEMNRIVRSLL